MTWASMQIGISGVTAARRAMEVVSENLVNSNTPGYTRRRVEQAVVGRLAPMPGELPREIEAGVKVTGVTRMRDEMLDASYRANASGVSGARVRADVAARTEDVLGPLDSGLQDAQGDFWSAWERLSARPQDLAARQEVMAAGDRLAISLRTATQQLKQITAEVNARGVSTVDQLNDYATQVAKLNQEIGDAAFRGAAPNDLFDQRDALLDKISKIVSITVQETPDRMAKVFVGSFPLVDGVTSSPIDQPVVGGPVWGIGGFPVDLSGELAAIQEAKTLTLPDIQAKLDALAEELMTAVNDQHAAGLDLDGNVGAAFFVGMSAADIQLSTSMTPRGIAAGTTSAPADNRNALALAKVGSMTLLSGNTIDGMLAGLAAQLGTSAQSTEQMAGVLSASLAGLDDQRSSLTGVSVDEELSDLIRYQRAFEASARVLTIADEILDNIINRMGRG